jgi:hypothetical protein
MDIIYVVVIVAFFVATYGLVRFCATLMEQGDSR